MGRRGDVKSPLHIARDSLSANVSISRNMGTRHRAPSETLSRSFIQLALRQRAVPVYWGPLFVDDDDDVHIQPAGDVARRVLVLWAVELRAEGIPQTEALGIIEQLDLWSSVSPSEKAFLQNDRPDPDECRRLVWRLESIWVLMWALGYIEELDWPSGMCDVPKLAKWPSLIPGGNVKQGLAITYVVERRHRSERSP